MSVPSAATCGCPSAAALNRPPNRRQLILDGERHYAGPIRGHFLAVRKAGHLTALHQRKASRIPDVAQNRWAMANGGNRLAGPMHRFDESDRTGILAQVENRPQTPAVKHRIVDIGPDRRQLSMCWPEPAERGGRRQNAGSPGFGTPLPCWWDRSAPSRPPRMRGPPLSARNPEKRSRTANLLEPGTRHLRSRNKTYSEHDENPAPSSR